MGGAEPTGSETLVRLIYRSRSVTPLGTQETDAALRSILDRARTHNSACGITGVLLFDGAHFVQVIEGALREVEDLYETIACDLRHEAIEVVDFMPAEAREYESFSMAFLEVTDDRFPELRQLMSRAMQGLAPPLSNLITNALASSPGQLRGPKEAVLF